MKGEINLIIVIVKNVILDNYYLYIFQINKKRVYIYQSWVQLRNCNWLCKNGVIVIESGFPHLAVIVI